MNQSRHRQEPAPKASSNGSGIEAPGTCFGWLAEIDKDLALVAQPKDKFDRVIATERLVEAGLPLMAEAGIAGSLSPVNRPC